VKEPEDIPLYEDGTIEVGCIISSSVDSKPTLVKLPMGLRKAVKN
jgi:hypothetical protein